MNAPPTRGPAIPPQSEKQFQGAIVELAQLMHYRVYHTFDSRRSAAGFPDLVLVKPPRLLFLECKREFGQLSGAQIAWLQSLRAVGGSVEAYAVWPSDWDAVVRILEGRP